MVLSSAERDELIRRVTERVAHRHGRDALIASVVDRVVGALAERDIPPAPATDQTVVVSAESMPDVASRLKAAMPGVTLEDVAVASEGRHHVLVARASGATLDAIRAAAEAIGARIVLGARA
ncbi:MAG: hypothetical protein IT361_13330 [Gemmatimonadaceae bacterium]|nr:hypothetical protein [Gemmatimonadaceae bacterium]